MKTLKSIIFFLVMVLVFIQPACSKKDWAAKIDDDVITMDEFNKFYYTQNKVLLNKTPKEIDEIADEPSLKNHPTLNKENFLDFLISRKLISKKAESDDTIDRKELKIVEDLFTLQGVSTYYLTEKLKDEINVSDDEINQFYTNNRSIFRGVPINDDIMNRIKQQIFLQKFEQKSSEFVMNLVAESKVVRDGFKKYLTSLSAGKNGKKEKIDLDDTAVEIDNEKISIEDFLKYYYTQNKILLNMTKEEIDKLALEPSAENHPTLSKSKFMDFLISRKLLYKKTMSDEKLKKDDVNTIIELFKLQGISAYYLTVKLKDEINVTDDEINKFYNEHRKEIGGLAMNEEVIAKIKQQIYMQKFEQKSQEFVMDLIAASRVNREGFRNYMKKKAADKAAKEKKGNAREAEKAGKSKGK